MSFLTRMVMFVGVGCTIFGGMMVLDSSGLNWWIGVLLVVVALACFGYVLRETVRDLRSSGWSVAPEKNPRPKQAPHNSSGDAK